MYRFCTLVRMIFWRVWLEYYFGLFVLFMLLLLLSANLYVYIWHWFIPIWKKNDIIILAFYTLLMPLELYPSNVFVMILLLSFVIITWQYISFITYLATAAKICPYLELCWVQVSMWDLYTNIETIVQEIIDRWNIIFSVIRQAYTSGYISYFCLYK